MIWTEKHMRLLTILTEDCRTPRGDIAAMLQMQEADVEEAIAQMEKEGVIVGYPAMVNWELTERELVDAVIEVRVTPQRDMGFDAIAERIYRFDDVKSVYLMSGAYDLMLEVKAQTLKELALFVSQRLSTLEHVLSTATHFVLKKYKVDGRILAKKPTDERLVISP